VRKVVAGLFVSLDGVTESPDGWQFDHFDDEMATEMSSQMAAQDAVLLGRVTYEEWASYWPSSTDEPFAGFINSTPKYVVSTTLEEPREWNNLTLIKGNVADEIANLKRQPGENIAVQVAPRSSNPCCKMTSSTSSSLWFIPSSLAAGSVCSETGGL
jgi:dihydrofolate reductase